MVHRLMDPKPGAKFGPYELLSRVGEGGMGQVWKARDSRLNRIVAIKFSSARFTNRFAQEARAIAALNHPHICTLYDVGKSKPKVRPFRLCKPRKLGSLR